MYSKLMLWCVSVIFLLIGLVVCVYHILYFIDRMPLFGSSKKSPQDICKNLIESLQVLQADTSGKRSEKVCVYICPYFC